MQYPVNVNGVIICNRNIISANDAICVILPKPFPYNYLGSDKAIGDSGCLSREVVDEVVDEVVRSSEQIALISLCLFSLSFFRFMLKLSDILPIRMRGR